MSKLNTAPRKFRIINRYCTVVRPEIKTSAQMTGSIHDYIDVPVIDTHGTWPILSGLTYDEMATLAIRLRQAKLL